MVVYLFSGQIINFISHVDEGRRAPEGRTDPRCKPTRYSKAWGGFSQLDRVSKEGPVILEVALRAVFREGVRLILSVRGFQ